ncbi:hypothetical protein GJ744_000078 [Endocarpon pusillum]|uniref:Uncharacterized protein n=1 Tax=Endocarpon pusillum TaxID=364733 RepID=A0A8H7ASB8_9EURO|nr:hypothetical protein GJ744_000078 [Endocarpon pusillum]
MATALVIVSVPANNETEDKAIPEENDGGASFFMDEAYQLADGHNTKSVAVLGFLLEDIDNQVGKFIFFPVSYANDGDVR